MVRYKNLSVVCNCGQLLAHYKKGGSGRLRKMYFDRIIQDLVNLSAQMEKVPDGTSVYCPSCQARVGNTALVSGKPALKINQGQIRL